MPSFLRLYFDEPTAVVTISIVVVSLWIGLSSVLKAGWKSAAILSYSVFAALLAYGFWRGNTFFLAMLGFSLVAGFTELLADRWLVRNTGKLHYAPREQFLVASPMYMPFSWAVILMEFAWTGSRIGGIYGIGWGVAAAAVGGGILIPFFEHCAKGAGFWYYTDWKHQWWDTPYFIMLGEALLAGALPLLVLCLRQPLLITAPLAGLLEGLWIWGAYYIAYKLLK